MYPPDPRRFAAVLVVLALGGLAACAPDFQDGAGPRVPTPNVLGQVLRDSAEAEDLGAVLRTQADAFVVAEVETDDDGEYAFADVDSGNWEVKVSGAEPGDWHSVSREFELVHPDSIIVLPTFDILAYGAIALEPDDGGSNPLPTVFQPLHFRWTLPDLEVTWARVYVFDSEGYDVWSSAKEPVAEAAWNGLGSSGEYEGMPVPAGTYSWRVKMELGNGQECRLAYRTLVLE